MITFKTYMPHYLELTDKLVKNIEYNLSLVSDFSYGTSNLNIELKMGNVMPARFSLIQIIVMITLITI